jgi:sugar (pentulose or hexulose) kinase
MTEQAVLDVGKTNAKLIAFSCEGRILEQLRHPQRVVADSGRRVLDVDGIFGWLETALAELRGRHEISGLMVSTHGATCALIGEDNALAAPILDYEQAFPAELSAEFTRIAPPFSETYSPDLPGGLNFARTIFFQEWADPTLAARVRHILTYPQYWTWRLSAALASEVSFLGCHSHMWNPRAGRFSSLAVSRGWAEKFPPFAPAGALVGERDGIGVHNGVHDSNAAFYYYKSLGFSHFTLISSGTWMIIFNPDCPLDRLDPARDMLANVTVDGEPVATIRFMGGREYDVISEQARLEVSAEMLQRAIARDQMALPSFAAGGPFPGHAGRLVGPAPESAAERAAIATLYVAMMTAECLDLVSSGGDIILDGGLAHNVALCATLAALRPGQSLFRNTNAEGTAMGAAALAFRALGRTSVFPRDIGKAEPWALPDLAGYYVRWRARVSSAGPDRIYPH